VAHDGQRPQDAGLGRVLVEQHQRPDLIQTALRVDDRAGQVVRVAVGPRTSSRQSVSAASPRRWYSSRSRPAGPEE
jgi:hypothetical protein